MESVSAAKARPEIPAKQARSRRTLDRLLAAVEDVLAREGLEAATVPRIARQAGMSVGVVYRRFPDKDALLRGAYERFFIRVREANRMGLDPAHWKHVPPEDIARTVIHGMTRGYLRHRSLLRALILYAQTHPDPRFRRHADDNNLATLAEVTALLLPYRRRFRHPNPRAGIQFGLVAVAATLRGLLLSEERAAERWTPPDEELGEELTRMFLGHLGLPQREVRAPWRVPPRGFAGPPKMERFDPVTRRAPRARGAKRRR